MVACRALIRKHLSLLKPGEIFTTRDLLSYGRRNTVDKATHDFVKAGYITRLAFGVFVVTHTSRAAYTVAEIVTRKAIAFGKAAHAHGQNFVVKKGWRIKITIHTTRGNAQKSDENEDPLNTCTAPVTYFQKFMYSGPPPYMKDFFFSCQASSSCFRFRSGVRNKIDTALLKTSCAKLLKHGDSNIGKAIRALVYAGPRKVNEDVVLDVLQQLNHREQTELRMASAWMPHWLSNLLITDQSAIASVRRFQSARS
jgi:hypothetical protein